MQTQELRSRTSGGASVTTTDRGWILGIQPGTDSEYRLAQLDDYADLSRAAFGWRAPLAVRLHARVSSASIPGTWGFGLWNNPFGIGCSPTKELARLPALPQTAWYFSASPKSYLSLSDSKPGQGFFAQVIRSSEPGLWLVAAGIRLPFDRRSARRRLSQNISEDGVPAGADPSGWHSYEIRWQNRSTELLVDGRILLNSPVSPRTPLGLVIWIDNQYAAFDPEGRVAWGLECNTEPAWLEVADLLSGSIEDHGDAGPRPVPRTSR